VTQSGRCPDEKYHKVRRLDKAPASRFFSTSQCLLKKGGKAARAEQREEKQTTAKGQSSDEPYDFSALEADIASAIEQLKDALSKLRAGGRFNPEVLENLRVQPDKKSNQTVKLSDLAQVVPKGRQVQILVGEQDVRPHQHLINPPV
jgi:ribosome recycling factor